MVSPKKSRITNGLAKAADSGGAAAIAAVKSGGGERRSIGPPLPADDRRRAWKMKIDLRRLAKLQELMARPVPEEPRRWANPAKRNHQRMVDRQKAAAEKLKPELRAWRHRWVGARAQIGALPSWQMMVCRMVPGEWHALGDLRALNPEYAEGTIGAKLKKELIDGGYVEKALNPRYDTGRHWTGQGCGGMYLYRLTAFGIQQREWFRVWL